MCIFQPHPVLSTVPLLHRTSQILSGHQTAQVDILLIRLHLCRWIFLFLWCLPLSQKKSSLKHPLVTVSNPTGHCVLSKAAIIKSDVAQLSGSHLFIYNRSKSERRVKLVDIYKVRNMWHIVLFSVFRVSATLTRSQNVSIYICLLHIPRLCSSTGKKLNG